MRYTYTEFVSKNRAGGLKQIKQSNKVVHQYESENIGRCHVLLLDKYLSKLPPGAKENDTFYLKLKQSAPTDPLKPWYTQVPIGRNVLGQMVKNMFKDANIEKPVTNHSLVPMGCRKCLPQVSQRRSLWSAVAIVPWRVSKRMSGPTPCRNYKFARCWTTSPFPTISCFLLFSNAHNLLFFHQLLIQLSSNPCNLATCGDSTSVYFSRMLIQQLHFSDVSAISA